MIQTLYGVGGIRITAVNNMPAEHAYIVLLTTF